MLQPPFRISLLWVVIKIWLMWFCYLLFLATEVKGDANGGGVRFVLELESRESRLHPWKSSRVHPQLSLTTYCCSVTEPNGCKVAFPPWSLTTSCRKVFNLQTFVPYWRPCNSDTVCSCHCTLSGYVPGGVVVDRGPKLRLEIDEKGAGRRSELDFFFHFFRVSGAKVEGQVIFSFIITIFFCKLYSRTMV
jgi:hypothetical protein